jgi:hypothetical protein
MILRRPNSAACGRPQYFGFRVPDDTWRAVVPEAHQRYRVIRLGLLVRRQVFVPESRCTEEPEPRVAEQVGALAVPACHTPRRTGRVPADDGAPAAERGP